MVSLTRKRNLFMKIVSEYKELEGRVFNTVGECAEAEGLIEVQRAELAEKKKKNFLKKKR